MFARPLRKIFDKNDDEKLKKAVERYGTSDWKKIASKMKGFSARQCKDRYEIYHQCENRNGKWEPWEDDFIISRFGEFGYKWKLYVPSLKGRNPNSIKNRYYRHLKDIIEKEPPKEQVKSTNSSMLELEKMPPLYNNETETSFADFNFMDNFLLPTDNELYSSFVFDDKQL